MDHKRQEEQQEGSQSVSSSDCQLRESGERENRKDSKKGEEEPVKTLEFVKKPEPEPEPERIPEPEPFVEVPEEASGVDLGFWSNGKESGLAKGEAEKVEIVKAEPKPSKEEKKKDDIRWDLSDTWDWPSSKKRKSKKNTKESQSRKRKERRKEREEREELEEPEERVEREERRRQKEDLKSVSSSGRQLEELGELRKRHKKDTTPLSRPVGFLGLFAGERQTELESEERRQLRENRRLRRQQEVEEREERRRQQRQQEEEGEGGDLHSRQLNESGKPSIGSHHKNSTQSSRQTRDGGSDTASDAYIQPLLQRIKELDEEVKQLRRKPEGGQVPWYTKHVESLCLFLGSNNTSIMVVISVVASNAVMTTHATLHPNDAQCAPMKGDSDFYVAISQAITSICSLYYLLVPYLRGTKWPVTSWFYFWWLVAVGTAIAGSALYVHDWKLSLWFVFASGTAQIVTAAVLFWQF